MTTYKVGDRLIALHFGYEIEITKELSFGIGGAQFLVKRLDNLRLKPR